MKAVGQEIFKDAQAAKTADFRARVSGDVRLLSTQKFALKVSEGVA